MSVSRKELEYLQSRMRTELGEIVTFHIEDHGEYAGWVDSVFVKDHWRTPISAAELMREILYSHWERKHAASIDR